MDEIRLQQSFWLSGKDTQRRGDAGAGELQGQAHAFSRTRDGAGIGDDCGWNAGADGAGTPRLQKRENLRRLSRPARPRTIGEEKMASARCENCEETKGCSGSRLCRSGRGKQQEIEEAACRRTAGQQ